MNGLTPRTYKDHRRFSFPKTFGTTADLAYLDLDTNTANFNENIPNPITEEPAMPNGCTAFARTDIAMNEDKIIYKPSFTYEKSCLMENVPIGSPLELETAFKSSIVYGLLALGETTDAQALTHRRGPYFEVHPVAGQDWFDALWSALQRGQKGISVGMPWFGDQINFLTQVESVVIHQTDDWHNPEAVGVQEVNGKPYMKLKWWGGQPKLFSREAINMLMAVNGTDALTDVDGKYMPNDIFTVQLTIKQTLISYYYRLLHLLYAQLAQ